MGLKKRMDAALARAAAGLRRFAGDRRGNVAMMLALATPALLLMTLGGVDIHRLGAVRSNLQDSLDAAALAAARSPYATDDKLTEVGLNTLRANLASHPDIALDLSGVSFALVDNVIVADARVQVKTMAAHIFLPPYGQFFDETLPVRTHSEVDRATKDIEVALVLDITGSMNEGTRMADLKSAANGLVDLVIQEDQEVNRTRVALVPYSMGVNAGDYADEARGAVRGPTNISNASWTPGGYKSISNVTRADPAVFTSNAHGLNDESYVWLTGVSSVSGSGSNLSNLNSRAYRIDRIDANKFSLERWNGSSWVKVDTSWGYRAYNSGGRVYPCHVSSCEVVVTSDNHGLSTGEDVRIDRVRGMTGINGDSRSVTRLTENTFILNGAIGPQIDQTYETRDSDYVQCLELGCQFYKFRNYYGNNLVKEVSTCVSERPGQAHSDVSGSVSPVGWAYPSSDNRCLGDTITPLTDNKDTLHDAINGYNAVGSTAGQVGVEWGWYMVSPTFGAIFPEAGRPDPYQPARRLKVVILMTDGEFNTPYCNGVVAGAASGSGDVGQHISCDNVPNPFKFSVDTCAAMKRAGVIVYTVGFAVSSSEGAAGVDTAKEVMQQCATNADHVYLPNSGTSLKDAFAAIGRSIRQLRISK